MNTSKVKHRYSSSPTKSQSGDKSSLLFWIMLCVTLIFLVWAPFQKALFNGNTSDFERPLYSFLLWGAILLFTVAIYGYYHWKFNNISGVVAICIWLIPLTYLISMFSAASHYFSFNMLLIQVTYTSFFLLGYFISKEKMGSRILINGIMIAGYIIVWFGLLNWFGNKEFAYGLVKWFAPGMASNVYQDAIMSDASGVRLTSVFQYANSYAALLIALLIGAIYLVSISKKWFDTLFHSFMIIPILISFLVTLSRGAYVILPLVLLAIFLILKPYRQLLMILYLIIGVIFTFIILGKVTDIGVQLSKEYNSSLSLQGWAALLIMSICLSTVFILVQRFLSSKFELKLSRISDVRFSNLFIPVGAIVIGALGLFLLLGNTGVLNLLPDNLKNRIETINFQQNSVIERGTFYIDAIKLFKDYPVTGAGGGAWAALYEKYQNNPYVSRQAHNFFLQYLVEVGSLGFLIFIIILGIVLYLFIRNHFKNNEDTPRFIFIIIAASLLIHSMIDFDLSFVYLGVLLFICLGAMISDLKVGLLNKQWTFTNNLKWIYPSILLIISLVTFFNAAQLLNANSNFRAAQAAVQSDKSTINDILTPVNNALKQHPNHPDYASFKADILLQAYDQSKDERFFNDAVTLIQQTREKEPHNRYLIDKEIYTLTVKNQFTKAYELINNEIGNFPWDITLYEKSINLAFSLGDQARTSKNTAQMNHYYDDAIATYSKILDKTKVLEALPKEQQQGRAFGLTKTMAFTLGQIKYIRGDYAAAENFLKFQINDQFDDQMNKQMVRWYLASLQKQNKNDQALYDKLIAKDAKERDEINKLVSATF
ncbi:DMT family transporter [Paenibacillus rigui]|uniref:Polymerase n=1 Tax=Paenibacillus rigui TaxID=554312 RepID=A0A229USA5_9BACL|nr:DMT family transporter [Paenibacillus rigui]OXM86517.1 polymerase [Paenibacillus rigui]